MSDKNAVLTCDQCGLHYHASAVPHQCADWTKGHATPPNEGGITPREIGGRFCCLCGWPLPTYDVTFYSPYGGRYMVTIYCPVCQRLWDGDSKDSETIIDHPFNKAVSN